MVSRLELRALLSNRNGLDDDLLGLPSFRLRPDSENLAPRAPALVTVLVHVVTGLSSPLHVLWVCWIRPVAFLDGDLTTLMIPASQFPRLLLDLSDVDESTLETWRGVGTSVIVIERQKIMNKKFVSNQIIGCGCSASISTYY